MNILSLDVQKKQNQDNLYKLRKKLTAKNELKDSFETDYKRNPRSNIFSNQKTPNQKNRFWDNQKQLTIQILAKIIMAFVIILTTMETTSKRLMHNHPSMPRGFKPMMIGILEETNSDKMNKLLNSSRK